MGYSPRCKSVKLQGGLPPITVSIVPEVSGIVALSQNHPKRGLQWLDIYPSDVPALREALKHFTVIE